jgi:hypothetical protein
MNSDQTQYWFPAKKYGWGWGLPIKWQGWVVLGTFVVLVAGGGLLILPAQGRGLFMAYAGALCVLLVAICWKTGEPPRWRGKV